MKNGNSIRLLAILMTLCMLIGLMPVAAMAEDAPGIPESNPAGMEGKTVILHTNDIHGAIAGYAVVAGLKAEYESLGAEVILTDAGDYSQGTTYVSTTKGADAIDMMNIAGYDIVTIGNHEFDYGYAQLAENMKKAEFKVLCANILDEDGKPIFDANMIYTTESGVKIGFLGLDTPEAQTKANPAKIQGLTFLTGKEFYACAQEEIDALEEQGADVIVCLAHLGVDPESEPYRSVDLLNNTSGIDMLIDGHSHTVMTEGENGEPIQSTGTALENIGVIVIDDETKAVEDNYLVPVTEDMAADEAVAAAAQKIMDRVIAEYGEVFAVSEVDLNGARAPGNRTEETNLGDLITDAMVWTIQKDAGSVKVPAENIVAITNGGGIRAPIAKGDISKNDVNTVLPFGNTVTVVYVTGAEMLEALEASTYCSPTAIGGFPQFAGMKITLNTFKKYDAREETYPGSTYYGPASINRVTIGSVNGKPFDPEATYAVITNDFCAGGGDTYYAFANASAQFDTGIPMDEAVMDYITTELKGVVGEKYAAPQGRLSFAASSFVDVPANQYYTDAVNALAAEGIIKGTSEDEFSPKMGFTRGMIVTILYRMVETDITTKGSEVFSDVAAGSYCDLAVGWAKEAGIVDGCPDGTFKPNDKITRQDFATILYRFAEVVEVVEDTLLDEAPDATTAKDYDAVSDYAQDAMTWAVGSGVIGGTSSDVLTLSPKGTASRAEAATMVYRFLCAAA